MRLFCALAAFCAFAIAGTASAQEPQKEGPKAERKICKTDKSTGSLTRRTRVCMTQAEWDEVNQNSRRELDKLVQHGGRASPAANPLTPGL